MLRQMVEKMFGGIGDLFLAADANERQLKVRDNRPVEVTPRLALPAVSSLDDMRRAMEILSREKAASGGETFEEFWNFGDDLEFADMEEMPAPAQLKAHSIMEAFTHNFEDEVKAETDRRKALARDVLKAELRKEIADELAGVKRAEGPGTESAL